MSDDIGKTRHLTRRYIFVLGMVAVLFVSVYSSFRHSLKPLQALDEARHVLDHQQIVGQELINVVSQWVAEGVPAKRALLRKSILKKKADFEKNLSVKLPDPMVNQAGSPAMGPTFASRQQLRIVLNRFLEKLEVLLGMEDIQAEKGVSLLADLEETVNTQIVPSMS